MVIAVPLVGAIAAWKAGGEMIEIGLFMVNGPYPAESITTTSAPEFDTLIARPNVRHGVGRVQSLVSKPEDATQLRVS